MNYQYKLIVSNNSIYKEFELLPDMEKIRLGTTSQCDLRLDQDLFFESIELIFEKKEEWNLICSDSLYINKGDVRKLFFAELIHGDYFDVCYNASGERAFSLRFLIDFDAEGHEYNLGLNLMSVPELVIGDEKSAHIQLLSDFGKNTKIVLKAVDKRVQITDFKSKYGTYLNGKKLTGTATLKENDYISIANFSACYKDGYIYFSDKNVWICGITDKIIYDQKAGNYPLFIRNARIKAEYNEEAIKVLDPENIPVKPDLNIVMSLLPALAMFALVVILRGVLSTTGGTFVIFSICTMGLGVITSIMSIFDKKKKYKKACEKRIETYNNYIENKRKEIQNARENERTLLCERFYSTEEDLKHIEMFSPVLFDRTPGDDDYLEVYLGRGITKSKRRIDFKEQEKLESGDDLCKIPAKLAAEYEYIDNAPVTIGLKEANAVGVVGETTDLYEMFKCILVDVISRQYQSDIEIYTLLEAGAESRFDWIKQLPQIQGMEGSRNIVVDSESKNAVFENLYKKLSVNKPSVFNVVFVLSEWGIKSHPLFKFVQTASELNTVFIFFEKNMESLPLYCKSVINLLGGNKAEVFDTEDKTDVRDFTYYSVPENRIKHAVQILAPVYSEEISLESSLRKSISIFELLGIYNVNDLDIKKRWEKSKICDSMAAPLGVNAKNEIVYLDLHEKFHGPHGLVAGTTGSGKSEILQTYILSMATLFHPYEVGFLIIDFKGGGMVNQFKKLPHLLGAITNIDGKAIERSLKSIKAELLKRQELFAQAEVNSIEKYINAYKVGIAEIPLPHLIIIVDEFAELKAEQPEFMKELISTARIGRSLGVHLILATQKPAGQVNDQIWSNSRFKLCLKVQTQEDSNEVLKSPLAAEIREPGRAYLQVGNNELFELLQSGYSGAPEKNDGAVQSIRINSLDFAGRRKVEYIRKSRKSDNYKTQLDVIVEHVANCFEDIADEPLQQICLPDLPEILEYKDDCASKDAVLSTPIGIYDNPEHQLQSDAIVEIGTSNTIIIGSAQYGKTNLLETIIKNLSSRYSPSEINLYIIDFGSMVLKNFEYLPHVGGVVLPSDDEKLKNLFKLLQEQVAERKELLLKAGVSSFASYKEAGLSDISQIVVLIDNITVLKELYLQDSDILLDLCREGLAVGISFVVTNMQTSGLGYKYMSNFSSRVAFTCNEQSEYATIFGSCRTQPAPVPGRCLIEIEKSIFECQTYMAFKGEREFDRIQEMLQYVEVQKQLYPNEKARLIPEIPTQLSERYMEENYASGNFEKLPIGLDYSSVEPVFVNLRRPNILALCGPDDSGKSNFIKYFINLIVNSDMESSIYVFDDYRKKLSDLCRNAEISLYELQSIRHKEFLLSLDTELQAAYQKVITGGEEPSEMKVIVFNNPDVIADISGDKTMMGIVKDIINKYKMLNVFIILGCVPNSQIVYGAPELYKIAKETRNILFFDNLDMCKLIDVPALVVRNNRKRIERGDAYFIHDLDFYKIKTPLAEQ